MQKRKYKSKSTEVRTLSYVPTRNRTTAAGPAHYTDTPPTFHGCTNNAVRHPLTSLGRSIPETQTGTKVNNRTIYRPIIFWNAPTLGYHVV